MGSNERASATHAPMDESSLTWNGMMQSHNHSNPKLFANSSLNRSRNRRSDCTTPPQQSTRRRIKPHTAMLSSQPHQTTYTTNYKTRLVLQDTARSPQYVAEKYTYSETTKRHQISGRSMYSISSTFVLFQSSNSY